MITPKTRNEANQVKLALALRMLKHEVDSLKLLFASEHIDIGIGGQGELVVRFDDQEFPLRGQAGLPGRPGEIIREKKIVPLVDQRQMRRLNEFDGKFETLAETLGDFNKRLQELTDRPSDKIEKTRVVDEPPRKKDPSMAKEIENLRNDLMAFKSKTLADLNMKIMGISSGGGEVNLKFLDDVDYNSAVENAGGVMYMDADDGRFKFSSKIRITDGDVLHIDTFALLGQTIEPAANGNITVNYSNGNFVDVTLTQNVTSFIIAGWPAAPEIGKMTLNIRQNSDGTPGYINNWPTGTKFPQGVAPTLGTANAALDIVVLITTDGGTEIIGTHAGANYSEV